MTRSHLSINRVRELFRDPRPERGSLLSADDPTASHPERDEVDLEAPQIRMLSRTFGGQCWWLFPKGLDEMSTTALHPLLLSPEVAIRSK